MTIDSGEFRTGESSHLLFSPYCSSTKLLEDIFWLGRKAHGNAEREKKKLLLLISSLLLTCLPACQVPQDIKMGLMGKKYEYLWYIMMTIFIFSLSLTYFFACPSENCDKKPWKNGEKSLTRLWSFAVISVLVYLCFLYITLLSLFQAGYCTEHADLQYIPYIR